MVCDLVSVGRAAVNWYSALALVSLVDGRGWRDGVERHAEGHEHRKRACVASPGVGRELRFFL